MSEEQAVNAEEQQQNAGGQQDEADFEAGFSGTEVKATETPANTETPAAGKEQQAEQSEQQQVATPSEPETVQITREQFEKLTKAADMVDSLSKGQDKVFGKLGAFEQMLANLQANTPSGQQIEVSEADFEELAKEFPDLAALQIKGLNKVLGKMRGTGGQSVDPKQIETVVQERIAQAVGEQRANMIDEVLSDRHADWKELRDNNPADYQEWLASLPEADRNAYKSSNNPFFVAKKLDEFKAYRAKRAAPGKTETPVTATRKEIIQAAVAPRGTGGQPPAKTGDDDFEAGFNQTTRALSG